MTKTRHGPDRGVNDKPIIAITIGEVSGIGPEILLKALCQGSLGEVCRPLVVGDLKVMQRAGSMLGLEPEYDVAGSFEDLNWQKPGIRLLDLSNIDMGNLVPGHPNAMTGKAMVEYAGLAVRLAVAGKIAGAVGGPHSKKAAVDAGYQFDGYPNFVAGISGSENPFLLLVAGRLRVANVTLHVSLRQAVAMIKKDLVLKCISETSRAVTDLGVLKPKIAVAGLNPHAGEDGMFGGEDNDEIKPAVQAARKLGIDAAGPLPADSLFFNCMESEYDAYIGMYHDQAHMPVKTLAFRKAVAVVIGVPVNWATVGHGCGLDIAWQGRADAGAMLETIRLVSTRA